MSRAHIHSHPRVSIAPYHIGAIISTPTQSARLDHRTASASQIVRLSPRPHGLTWLARFPFQR